MIIRNDKNTRAWICFALAALTFAVYWPVHGFDFVNYDDPDYVTENPIVQSGLSLKNIAWAFTHFYVSNWHPLTLISHMTDYQVFGLNAGWLHLVNVSFHAANAVLLFVLFYGMTGARWRSAVVAALFALHPLHVESVAWISERKDVLSTFFALLSILAYVRWVQKGAFSSKVCALGFFVLGLLSKPMIVTLPCMLLLLDIWPLKRVENSGLRTFFVPQFRKLAIEKWPWFSLSIASAIVTIWAQKAGGAVADTISFPLLWRLENAIESLCGYGQKTFWPTNLAVFYPLQHYRNLAHFLVCVVFLVIISGLVITTAKKRPYLFIGCAWFLVTLLPVLGLIQVGNQAMADRYSYIPLIGLFVALVWLGHDILCHSVVATRLTCVAAGIALLLCGISTEIQLRHWKNGLALCGHALSVTHDNAEMQNNFAVALVRAGRQPESIDHYAEAVRLAPGNARFQNNYATALARNGRQAEALEHYSAAIQLNPDYGEAYSNIGALLFAQQGFDEAITNLQKAVELNPDSGDAHNNLGSLYLRKGRPDEAAAHYAQALRIMGTNASIHFNLGLCLNRLNRADEAAAQFLETLRLNPASAEAHYELGRHLFAQHQFSSAIEHFSQAVQLKPNYAAAEFYYGKTCAELRDDKAALQHLQKASALRPNWAEPLNEQALLQANSQDKSVQNNEEALRLAKKAAELTSYGQPLILETLASLYAKQGMFDDAITTVGKAIEVAQAMNQTNLVLKLQSEASVYQSRSPQ